MHVGPILLDVRKKASDLASLGLMPSKEDLSEQILEKFLNYHPRIGSDPLLDDEDRENLSRGLAGVLRRIVIAEKKD
jgi:hypothetical protein